MPMTEAQRHTFNDRVEQTSNRVSLAATLLVTTLTVAAEAEPSQYLCTGEQAAGIHYDNRTNAWKPQAFAAGKKYVLRRLNDDDRDKNGKWWALVDNHP